MTKVASGSKAGLAIEMRRLADIVPYERNPRVNDQAVAAVAESITRFGFRQPIVVDGDGVIVCGHTRWKAAQSLGLAEAPVHVAADLTPEQAKAYRIADNRTAELSEWDLELLPLELSGLQEIGLDWNLLGFAERELHKLLEPEVAEGEGEADSVPEPPDEAITQPGDLWILGEHRLLCGDSSNADDVQRLLDGEPVQLVNTDPPYNVAVQPRSKNAFVTGQTNFAPQKQGKTKRGRGLDAKGKAGPTSGTTAKLRAKDRPLANDFVSGEEFDRLLMAWFHNAADALEPGRAFYIWGGYANIANYPSALDAAGLKFAQQIIWHKMHPVISRKDFMGDHEWCFYGWREGAAHVFLGPNNVPDVWQVKKVNPQSMVHLTEKPAELAVRAMQCSSRPGERVLDLFGGSGSTLIAAEQTQRRALLMELDPLYCDVIVTRWEQFTGGKAERENATAKAGA
ncbi:MAG: DNA modification methylase [Phycisphaera sp.]|nr:MAG: DNA modification methylase [Phycisphaera sp.]